MGRVPLIYLIRADPDGPLIVDGNNLMHADAGLSATADFDVARRKLVRRIEEIAATWKRITIVFDGRREAGTTEKAGGNLEIVFAPRHLTADSVIERMAHSATMRDELLVVTSDRGERELVEALGVVTISCRTFLEQMAEHRRRLASGLRNSRENSGAVVLGDFFP
jgi:predicted RNA-binding protein with PIN domain